MASASRLRANELLAQESVFVTTRGNCMNIRIIFQNENHEWRSGWRIVAMVAVLGVVGVAVNVG